MGVGNEQSGSRVHGGGGTQAVVLKLTWWKWQMSSRARIDTVGVGDKQLGSRVHGRGGTSSCARIDVVGVADKHLGLN